jgi:hypothetical protein
LRIRKRRAAWPNKRDAHNGARGPPQIPVAILLKNNRHLFRLSNEEIWYSIATEEQGN